MKEKPKVIPKRRCPSPEIIAWRSQFLQELQVLSPSDVEYAGPPALEPGNSKIGRSGKFFESVFVWNLPAVATCPGASSWCLSHCYNADERKDVFPLEKWRANWAAYLDKPSLLKENIINQLQDAPKPCAVRIHSSGDFFDEDYIRFWIDLVTQAKDVAFWAYTRSWDVPRLREPLEELRRCSNVQLFASYDEAMSAPPEGWRLSFVTKDADDPIASHHGATLQCPEQFGLLPNCASCACCISEREGHILFTLH